jgi:hypothetical protein
VPQRSSILTVTLGGWAPVPLAWPCDRRRFVGSGGTASACNVGRFEATWTGSRDRHCLRSGSEGDRRFAGDVFGNFWILDLPPDEVETAPVFFACHDAPVILYQSKNIGDFLHEAFRMLVPPHTSAVDDVHEDRLFNVWRDNPGTLDHSAALAGDERLHAFATELDDRFTFVDLRSSPVGMGFSWGRYGPRTEVRRHGHEPLFAYAPPEKRPGIFRRLLGHANEQGR